MNEKQPIRYAVVNNDNDIHYVSHDLNEATKWRNLAERPGDPLWIKIWVSGTKSNSKFI